MSATQLGDELLEVGPGPGVIGLPASRRADPGADDADTGQHRVRSQRLDLWADR
jgi:hypothetical protein